MIEVIQPLEDLLKDSCTCYLMGGTAVNPNCPVHK